MNALGAMYEVGHGVLKDDREAVRWYRGAAERGDPDGQDNLGTMYLAGRGIAQDDAEALKWFRRAAEQGGTGGMNHLGVMYADGRGVPRDAGEAVKWYRQAAELGNPAAQANLGLMYESGRGVPHDDANAVQWFRLAAEHGLVEGQNALGGMYAGGRGVPRDDSEAAEWFRRAAEQGFADAQNALGAMYLAGRGVTQDDADAVTWFRRAATQGHPEAQRNLGGMYMNGRGVSRDDIQAMAWLRRAAAQGDAAAMTSVGWMYANERGVPKDYGEALRWYQRAAEAGDITGQVDLGLAYASGQGVPQDCAEAVRWLRMAAERNFAEGEAGLGAMYENGCGVPEDQVQAYLWYALAAAQGHQISLRRRDALAREMEPDKLAHAEDLVREWRSRHGVSADASAPPAPGRPSALSRSASVAMTSSLIPREVLFGGEGKWMPRLSPDGARVAYLAPFHGVLNVWVRATATSISGGGNGQAITADIQDGIRFFAWQCDGKHILYIRDHDGDEKWRLYQVDVETKATRDLIPAGSVLVGFPGKDCHYPDRLLAALSTGRPPDAYRVNLVTGALELDSKNPGDVFQWWADHRFRVRGALARAPNGETIVRVRSTARAPWRELQRWGVDEAFGGTAGFAADDRSLLLISSLGASAARLVRVDLGNGRSTVLAEDSDYDVGGVMINPETAQVEAVAFSRAHIGWTLVDRSLQGDFDALGRLDKGDFEVVSRTRDDKIWLVRFVEDKESAADYVWDHTARRALSLLLEQPALARFSLARMRAVTFEARDGMVLHAYLTLPVGVRPRGLPTVLKVHGGPWQRDVWGLDPETQWLANRGYVVLQVNFRGSAGYGKAYLNAGNREWGGKMLTDLIDAKNWAVREGYTDRSRVCIMGVSYGGYATLAALAFTPDEFRCGIDVSGVSNLVAHIRSFPPHAMFQANWDERVGRIEADEDFLKLRSPFFRADQVRAPLLVAQGGNDPVVSRVQSDVMVEAVRRSGTPVRYLVFPNEGHGFERPENRLRFYAAAEQFLAQALGGRVEAPSSQEAWEAFQR